MFDELNEIIVRNIQYPMFSPYSKIDYEKENCYYANIYLFNEHLNQNPSRGRDGDKRASGNRS